jgi:hypothetical protein
MKFASKFIIKDLMVLILAVIIIIYLHKINILNNYIFIETSLKILIYYYFIAVFSILITDRYEISFVALMLGILLVDNIYSINIYFLIPSLILLILGLYYILLKLEDKK